jgi:hypothetical protein
MTVEGQTVQPAGIWMVNGTERCKEESCGQAATHIEIPDEMYVALAIFRNQPLQNSGPPVDNSPHDGPLDAAHELLGHHGTKSLLCFPPAFDPVTVPLCGRRVQPE